MKKIELIKDISIMGIGTIKAGTQFKVETHNSRNVFVEYRGCTLMLGKKDIKVIY